MNLFIAVFDDKNDLPEVLTGGRSDLITDTLRLSDNAFMIRSPVDRPAAMDDILVGDDPSSYRVVLVLKLNGSYSGFNSRDVWEWLDKSRVAQGG